MKIEIVYPQDWRPGQNRRIAEELLLQILDENDRSDASKTENHGDPYAVDCPAIAEMAFV